MFPQLITNDITHVIQLAVAPVFLLTAVGTIIGVLANRLTRIVDRIRVVEQQLLELGPEARRPAQDERKTLGRRLRLIYLAITCQVFCALFVGLVIVFAFIDAFVASNLSKFIGGLFVLAMVAFISALLVFLREIFLAITTTRTMMR
jgi:hypothetical protein